MPKYSLEKCRESLAPGRVKLEKGLMFMLVPRPGLLDQRLLGTAFVYYVDQCAKCKQLASRFFAMPQDYGLHCRRCDHIWMSGEDEEGQFA